ncbi:uncharacterized protein LOC129229366 [Uloborus diversus]|uniref:uncharacterized protein LOC129229366 n=1 Tax=Uloborus diversus TaxID=327109 RepID=UPI0024098BDC|nr:uncharacterized protein LOC129229366 [Uloborus diversus]
MMEISFYVLLVLAGMVLLLAMWACAASNTYQWGPDLTLELPPYLLQEALFGKQKTSASSAKAQTKVSVPSDPSELQCDPLLSNEQPMGQSSPPQRHPRTVVLNMSTAVQVLPVQHKGRPVFCTFSTEEPA